MSATAVAETAWTRLQASTIWHAGGVLCMRLLDEKGRQTLLEEALARHAVATEARRTTPVNENTVRGDPARWLETAPGGPQLAAFLAAPALLAMLRRVTGLRFVPSGPQGTYSYYRRAGHHLDVHRDIDVCDLAIVTCLADDGAGPGDVALQVYPDRRDEPTSQVRRSPALGGRRVPLAPGESAVLLGGVVPHRVPPIGAGRVRIVAPLCYRLDG